jgi:tetratricopeptide (TPR) repeat protein
VTILATIVSAFTGCSENDPIKEVRKQIVAGDLAGGLERMRELVQADPNNPQLLFVYGQVLIRTGAPASAEWPLRKAMQDPEWFEAAATLVAETELAGGNYENAAQIFAEILEANPDNLEIRLKRANACVQSPRMAEEGLAEVERIFERAPGDLRAYKPLILANLNLDRADEAEQAIEEFGTRIEEETESDDPIRGWYCATTAIFAADKGDETAARERWAVCEESFPSHPNVVEQSLLFHKSKGDLARSLEVAEAAFADDPSPNAGYRMAVADLLRLMDRPEEAETLLRETLDDSDLLPMNRVGAWTALAQHYKQVGELEACADSLEHAITLGQEFLGPQPDLVFALADVLVLLDQDERALEVANDMQISGHRTLIRARVAQKAKHYAKALQLYEETSRLWPENAFAPYHAGGAALALGDFDRARDNFLLAVRVDSSLTDARFRAAQLMLAEGLLRTAFELVFGGPTEGRTLDAELLIVRLSAQMQGVAAGAAAANRMSKSLEAHYGEAIAAAADGLGEREEAHAPWALLEPVLSLDLSPVDRLPILQSAVKWAPGDEELAILEPLVERSVESDPDSAFTAEIEGMLFERLGRPDQAEASYRRALDAEPGRVSVLLRLAGIEASAEPERAIELVGQALTEQRSSTRPFAPELFLAVASELLESPGVEPLYETALELEPTNSEIAIRLGNLIDRRRGDHRRVLELARRAIRFQGGKEAADLFDRATEELSDRGKPGETG